MTYNDADYRVLTVNHQEMSPCATEPSELDEVKLVPRLLSRHDGAFKDMEGVVQKVENERHCEEEQ